jgi:uncharacterized FlaG/YvyC family protein
MEYGLMSTINQYADNQELILQQVQPSSEIAKLSNNNETKQVTRDDSLKGIDEKKEGTSKTSETKEVKAQDVTKYQEVILTNLNFGFNSESRDFYVKAIRGEAENQYPTDEMMKLKAHYLQKLSKLFHNF